MEGFADAGVEHGSQRSSLSGSLFGGAGDGGSLDDKSDEARLDRVLGWT